MTLSLTTYENLVEPVNRRPLKMTSKAARRAAYRKANKHRISAYNRIYRQKNPDKRETREQANEYNRRYYRKNVRKIVDKVERRKRGIRGKLSSDIISILWRQQSGFCAYYSFCKSMLNVSGYHLDHIWPVCLGGINTDSNVQLLCPSCNLKKSGRRPDEFLRLIGLSK